MVIFKITNKDKNNKSYYDLSLNGYKFAAKVRTILQGQNKRFNRFYPINQDLKNGDWFVVEVIKINIPYDNVNSEMMRLLKEDDNTYNANTQPLFKDTILKHYVPIELWSLEESQSLYLELLSTYGNNLENMLYDYLYLGFSEEQIKTKFSLNDLELKIILKGLALYINNIEFTRR